MVGMGGLEPPTSSLSEMRSNRLSYTPITHSITNNGASGRIWTTDTRLFRPLLYPWATLASTYISNRNYKAECMWLNEIMHCTMRTSGMRDSNSRPLGPKPSALAIWANPRRTTLFITQWASVYECSIKMQDNFEYCKKFRIRSKANTSINI